jgi:hypothetical protein
LFVCFVGGFCGCGRGNVESFERQRKVERRNNSARDRIFCGNSAARCGKSPHTARIKVCCLCFLFVFFSEKKKIPRMQQLCDRIGKLIGFENGKIIPRVKHLSRISFEQGKKKKISYFCE